MIFVFNFKKAKSFYLLKIFVEVEQKMRVIDTVLAWNFVVGDANMQLWKEKRKKIKVIFVVVVRGVTRPDPNKIRRYRVGFVRVQLSLSGLSINPIA